jgi:hypothetical protein
MKRFNRIPFLKIIKEKPNEYAMPIEKSVMETPVISR